MATSAFIGSQTQLKIGDAASPEVFTLIGEVVSIGDFGQENDLIEATHMMSTAKEYIYGLADGVELPVVCNYLPTQAQQVAALAAQAAKTTKNFKLVLPTTGGGGLTFTFSALIKGWRIPMAPNEIDRITFNLKISGSITGPV